MTTAEKISKSIEREEENFAKNQNLTYYIMETWKGEDGRLFKILGHGKALRKAEVEIIQDHNDMGKMFYQIIYV
jgi:hypothetical protein